MPAFLKELAENFRLADFFDIAIIAFLLYSALIWFKRTASRSVLIGISVLGVVYLMARTYDLVLTSLLFHALFAVLLVALVIIFQEDVRRAFEQIAAWGTFRERRRSARSGMVDPLIEAVSTLAANRTGALIVIKGREPLDRHVEGGIPLQGKLSKLLLYSIFDPHSPGHDGAVLLEGERVVKFGAHLPLSKNMTEVGMRGTRHSAALGMSECSDSFVIVVSEESGALSVAEAGRLRAMTSAAELKGRLEQFYASRFPMEAEPEWKRLFKQNARIKVFSLFLACAFWFLFAYRAETVQRTYDVPIEYRNLPGGWILEGWRPVGARVTLSGRARSFELLNPASLIISVDLADLREGSQEVILTPEILKKSPASLSVTRIEPNIIRLDARGTTTAHLPIDVRTEGKVREPLQLVGVKVLPSSVRARLRRVDMDKDLRIATEPIRLDLLTQTTVIKPKLVLPPNVALVDPDPEVRVTVEVAGTVSEPATAAP
ncbi:MAG: DNA integrity scanning protein DisA nucleotide-binding domain protein [Candidatus Omnitrophica bacterium]|nr:DNA integrity scanning protein DisA nucleotide-binding domain protein [Candidatus Omnitrophota bacterium]